MVDLQFARQVLKLAQKRSLTGNGNCRSWIKRDEFSERPQACGQAFFLDQTASLDKPPFAPATGGRKNALTKRKFLQRDSRADDVDLFLVTTKIDNRTAQRFRAHQHTLDRVEHFLGCFAIGRFVHLDQNVRAMKRNDGWFWPGSNERQKMHRDVAEKNVQELRVGALQSRDQRALFAGARRR